MQCVRHVIIRSSTNLVGDKMNKLFMMLFLIGVFVMTLTACTNTSDNSGQAFRTTGGITGDKPTVRCEAECDDGSSCSCEGSGCQCFCFPDYLPDARCAGSHAN